MSLEFWMELEFQVMGIQINVATRDNIISDTNIICFAYSRSHYEINFIAQTKDALTTYN